MLTRVDSVSFAPSVVAVMVFRLHNNVGFILVLVVFYFVVGRLPHAFPYRSGAILFPESLASSSRWKKLLIRSYRLPVLRTWIKNRVIPSSD